VELTVFAGSANGPLAQAVANTLGARLGHLTLNRFPDGELHIEIDETIRAHDVFVVQPASAPVGEHLLELLLIADACHRAGAARVTAVIPYLGYARQDRRANGREPVAARVVADLLQAGRIDRIVAVDLHVVSLEGFFAIPLEHLSAVPLLAEAARATVGPEAVVVSPDLGAVKLTERYAARLHLPVAIVHKTRVSGEEVRAERVVGDVLGRIPLIVDDMISTGATIEAAISALLAAGARPEVTVVATHALLVGTAAQRLAALPIRRLIATDSVAIPEGRRLPLEVVSIGPLLGETIDRLHRGQSLGDLIAHR